MVRCTETCSTGDKHWSAAFDCNTSFVFITTHHTGINRNKVLLETLSLQEIKKRITRILCNPNVHHCHMHNSAPLVPILSQINPSRPQPISLRSILTIQQKPTKCTFSKLIFQFLILVSSTCLEPEGSSSVRRLYIHAWYSRFKCTSISSLVGSRLCSILFIPMPVQRTAP